MQNFGRYQVMDSLGKGAMGIVYRCKDPQIGRIVAVKTVLIESTTAGNSAELRTRMMKEAQAAGILSHPNIVTIFDVGEQEDSVYIVMEYLEGTPLDEAVKGNRFLGAREVLQVTEQVGSALDYAHAKGIVHRDVKPANIMRTADNRSVLMDFGIAWMFDPNMNEKGALIGSPIYMSPEQIDGGDVTGRSDIYSLATVIYELLTGYRPFTGETFNEIVQAKYENKRLPLSQTNSSLPPSLESFFDRSLAADPMHRFRTGEDLLKGLRSAIFSSPGSSSFLTSTQNPLTSTSSGIRPTQNISGAIPPPQAQNKPSPIDQSDPHMAETMMMDKIGSRNKKPLDATQVVQNEPDELDVYAETMRHRLQETFSKTLNTAFKKDIVPKSPEDKQKQNTAPTPPKQPQQKYSTTVYRQQSSEQASAQQEQQQAPQQQAGPELEENIGKQLLKDRKDRVLFRSSEDLTVAGQKKLIVELKTAINMLDHDPENNEHIIDVGLLYMRLGKPQEALAYFKRSIKNDWESIDAYVAMAQIYSDYGAKDKSNEYWAIGEWLSERQVGRLQEENYFLLGKKLEKFGQVKGAILIWEEAGALQPWYLDTWKELSRYYLQMKDYKQALRTLQHVTKLSKYDAMAWRNLAVCYQNTKDYVSALNAWEKAARLEPSGEGGARARKQAAQLKSFLGV